MTDRFRCSRCDGLTNDPDDDGLCFVCRTYGTPGPTAKAPDWERRTAKLLPVDGGRRSLTNGATR